MTNPRRLTILIIFPETQSLRLEILGVRMPVSGEHPGAALRDEPILRRRVPLVRLEGDALLRRGPGRPRRPHGVHLPPRHQVHLPQVRSIRQHPEARQSVHPASEHRQRENVHLHLVLVYDSGHAAHHLGRLQNSDHFVPETEAEDLARQKQEHPDRGLRGADQESRTGRLVDSADVGHEHGLPDLQGDHIRVGQEN